MMLPKHRVEGGPEGFSWVLEPFSVGSPGLVAFRSSVPFGLYAPCVPLQCLFLNTNCQTYPPLPFPRQTVPLTSLWNQEGPVRRQSHILPWAHCCRLPPSDAQRVYFAVQIEAKVNDEADAGRGTLPAPNCLDFIAAGDFWIKPFLGQIMGCFNTQIQPPKDNGSQLDGRSGGSGGFPGCRKTQHTQKNTIYHQKTLVC